MAEYEEVTKVLSFMPYLRGLYGEEPAVVVSTTEQVIYYERGKRLDLGLKVGSPLMQGSVSERAIREGRRMTGRVPANLLGVAYMGTAVPIREGDRWIGAMAVLRPVEMEEKLQGMAQKMGSSVESVSAGSSGFAAAAEELAATSGELAANTGKIQEDVQGMDAIISLIMEIASQTHLLGLNAAIEAARAGDMGRGFNVVAEEIRKLAGRTQSSAKDVTGKLHRIKDNINVMAEHVLQVSAVAQEQAATSQEINASIQELEPLSRDLISIAEDLTK